MIRAGSSSGTRLPCSASSTSWHQMCCNLALWFCMVLLWLYQMIVYKNMQYIFHVYIYICKYAYTYIYMYIHVYVRVYIYIYIYIYTCIYIYLYLYTYMYICMYNHVYIYIYTVYVIVIEMKIIHITSYGVPYIIQYHIIRMNKHISGKSAQKVSCSKDQSHIAPGPWPSPCALWGPRRQLSCPEETAALRFWG